MDDKIEFTLTPVSGTLKEKGGYRAKFGKRANRVLGLADVIREAKEDGAFAGVSESLMKHYVCGILQSMIDHTAADGITRRIDDYLSVSLKVHGKFDREDEDFDPDKHKLALSLRPLVAFRPEFKLRPVNKDHKRQFRIYSIAAADGSRKSGEVVWQQDFVIKGDDLLPESDSPSVTTRMKRPDGGYITVDAKVVSATAQKIVCHWPERFGEGYEQGQMLVSVSRFKVEGHYEEGLDTREKKVGVYPA